MVFFNGWGVHATIAKGFSFDSWEFGKRGQNSERFRSCPILPSQARTVLSLAKHTGDPPAIAYAGDLPPLTFDSASTAVSRRA